MMSEFEYTDVSSDEDNFSDEEIILRVRKRKIPTDFNSIRVSKELHLYYSNLFIDSFSLIDLFVKSKVYTYDSFLKHFDSVNFHYIYSKPKWKFKQMYVSPHHYITTTQEALGVASKFLRSRSKMARIGAVYLLYTLHKTQPLKTYPINIKMEPVDYKNIKELVDNCLNEGLLHPAYCFYEMDMKKKITITANTTIPCLEANYPRPVVRKHLGRVADKYFKIDYEERKTIDISNKLLVMEHQMRDELAYINKLSNSTLGYDAAQEYKVDLSKALMDIDLTNNSNIAKHQNNENVLRKSRYKNKKNVAFPGKNESILDDMILTTENQEVQNIDSDSKTNTKIHKKKRKIGNNKTKTLKMKVEPDEPSTSSSSLPKLSTIIDSDSLDSSAESDDLCADTKYGEMILRYLEESDNNELLNQTSSYKKQEDNDNV